MSVEGLVSCCAFRRQEKPRLMTWHVRGEEEGPEGRDTFTRDNLFEWLLLLPEWVQRGGLEPELLDCF
jgi:hypothetical protein